MKPSDLDVFKALAVERRARIIALLRGRCLCAGALARVLGITPGAVSQHLDVLKASNLVAAERRGNFMHYRIAAGAHSKVMAAVDSLFDEGASEGHADQMFCTCPKHVTPSKEEVDLARGRNFEPGPVRKGDPYPQGRLRTD